MSRRRAKDRQREYAAVLSPGGGRGPGALGRYPSGNYHVGSPARRVSASLDWPQADLGGKRLPTSD